MEPICKQTETIPNNIHTLVENSTEYVRKMHCDTTKWSQSFRCAVPSCPNMSVKYDAECKGPFNFHNFPVDEHFRREWMEKCNIKKEADTYPIKICSSHFNLDDYERNYAEDLKNPNYKKKLKAEAVPSRNLGDDVVQLNFNQNDPARDVQNGNNFADQMEVEILPPLQVIKVAVDANIQLKEQIEKLRKEKRDVYHKIRLYDRKINTRRKDVIIVRSQYEKLRKNIPTIKEQRNLLSKVFSDAQVNVLLGKKKVFWSNDDLAMAFTLRQMSSRECYLYLKQMLNMPLPALSCVQKWAASK